MSSNGPSKAVTVKGVELELDMIFTGLQQVFPPTTTFAAGGKNLALADLLKEVDARRTVYKTVRQLRGDLRAATQTKRDRRPEIEAFIKDVRIAATANLGRQNPELTKLGFPVEKPRHDLTAEEKASRAAKARATRAARHTMGARQKAGVHGDEAPGAGPKPGNGKSV